MAISEQRDKILSKIAGMRMIDDTFMSAVFDGRNEETEMLLRIVLNKKVIASALVVVKLLVSISASWA